MKNRTFLGIFFFLTLITSTVFGSMAEISRQGSELIFTTPCQGPAVPLSATTAGFLEAEAKLTAGMTIITKYHGRTLEVLKDGLGSTIALTNKGGNTVSRMNYDAWGNLKFPDKLGHGVKPCEEKDLDDYLDRCDGGRAFENSGIDPYQLGRHHGKILDPYLFTGRRFDTFTDLYNSRNRYYSPKVGRFFSRDPIGFRGGYNLWAYSKNNPVNFSDPFGLRPPQIPPGSKTWTSLQDQIGKDIDKAVNLSDPFAFYDLVKNHGAWDFKNLAGYGSGWEDFGNYHFGIVAAATGMFYKETALREAGKAQCKAGTSLKAWGKPEDGPPYGDDPNDQKWINEGWEDYRSGLFGPPVFYGSRSQMTDLTEIISQAEKVDCPKKDDPNKECSPK